MPTKTTSYLQDLDRKHHLHPFTNHAEMHASGTHVITSLRECGLLTQSGVGFSMVWLGCGV
jgi:putrescine aminotransferase